jgi:glycosyltransferase involved in cell wall biosynthesis
VTSTAATTPGEVDGAETVEAAAITGSTAEAGCGRACGGNRPLTCANRTQRPPDPAGDSSARQGRELLTCLQLGAGWFPEHSGGLERYYFDLLDHLPAAAVKPTGLVAGSERVSIDSAGAVTAFSSASQNLLARLRSVRRSAAAAAARDFDLIASHFALYAMPAMSAFPDRPWVVHFHGPWSSEGRVNGGGRFGAFVKGLIEKRVYRRGDRFITLSEAFARLLSAQFRVPAEKIEVVPGGVDAARFSVPESRAEARAQLGWPTDRPIVLSVRRLVPRMGLENLIEAATHPSLRDAVFMIAGKGPLTGTLQQKIAATGPERRIRLLGYVPDEQLPLMYRAADLTIVPSVALEGFGLTAVESLMAGTPALVTPVGGLPEVVEKLSPDLIAESSRTEHLIARLRGSLSGAIDLPDADACREYARSNFDWHVIARKVRGVYERAIAEC